MGNIFKVRDFVEENKWARFVYNHPTGNIFQTPELMEVYKRTKMYESLFLAVVDESDNVKAMLLAHVIKEFESFSGQFSARSIILGGPLYKETEEGFNAPQILMEHYEGIREFKKQF